MPLPKSTKVASSVDKKLQALGLRSDMDFVLHLPLRYENRTQIHAINQIRFGQYVQLEGYIRHVQVVFRGKRMMTACLVDDTGEIKLRWFNFYQSQVKALSAEPKVRVRGEVRGHPHWGFEIIHPTLEKPGQPLPKTLTPIYPSTQGLSQISLRNKIDEALSKVMLSDTFPETVIGKWGLLPFVQAIQTLHHPAAQVDESTLMNKTHPAWKRIKIDELVAQQLALSQARTDRLSRRAFPYLVVQEPDLSEQLLAQQPFKLTAAQERVCQEMFADLQSLHPMQRLLQGDVGSGKTIVAAWLAAKVIQQGYQVAVMAPTEVLAAQHYEKFTSWFDPLGIKIAWLAGTQKASVKRQILKEIENHKVSIVIGTQAIIQKGVQFSKLALVIVDEQHRFGVGQRLELINKAESGQMVFSPHQLSMSATPIPRSLAMTYLADMDVSIIDELPPGRTPIKTQLINIQRRMELLKFILTEIEKGRQAYWVCPLVEESDALQLQAAEDTYRQLQQELPQLRIGLVHGRLNGNDKSQVMQDFINHRLDILVATTVIEVGIDVPNASLMVIEHAERFGLAQLHQLRGRVGRGTAQSFCVLLFQEPLSLDAKERLRAMYETQDGFEIARRDLKIRGPGEMLGLRQSGAPSLRFVDFQLDSSMISIARDISQCLIEEYPEAAQKHLGRWMEDKSQYLRS